MSDAAAPEPEEDPEDQSGKYIPDDLDEKRRAWIVDICVRDYAEHLGPCELVHAMDMIDKWLVQGVTPPKKELTNELKNKPVSQLRSV